MTSTMVISPKRKERREGLSREKIRPRVKKNIQPPPSSPLFPSRVSHQGIHGAIQFFASSFVSCPTADAHNATAAANHPNPSSAKKKLPFPPFPTPSLPLGAVSELSLSLLCLSLPFVSPPAAALDSAFCLRFHHEGGIKNSLAAASANSEICL